MRRNILMYLKTLAIFWSMTLDIIDHKTKFLLSIYQKKKSSSYCQKISMEMILMSIYEMNYYQTNWIRKIKS